MKCSVAIYIVKIRVATSSDQMSQGFKVTKKSSPSKGPFTNTNENTVIEASSTFHRIFRGRARFDGSRCSHFNHFLKFKKSLRKAYAFFVVMHDFAIFQLIKIKLKLVSLSSKLHRKFRAWPRKNSMKVR